MGALLKLSRVVDALNEGIGKVVTLRAETLALIASGRQVQTVIDDISAQIETFGRYGFNNRVRDRDCMVVDEERSAVMWNARAIPTRRSRSR